MAQMGFPVGFDSTHGKKVEHVDEGCARLRTGRSYRQYMNRRGGFNRVLDTESTKLKKKQFGLKKT